MTKHVYLLVKGRFLKVKFEEYYNISTEFRENMNFREKAWKVVVKQWRSLYKESRKGISHDKLVYVKQLSGGRIIEYYGIAPVIYFKFYNDPDTNYRLADPDFQKKLLNKKVQ